MPATPFETVEVDEHTETVGCDGGGGPAGHPLVYYNFGNKPSVQCSYCSRTFVRGGHSGPAGLERQDGSPDGSAGTGTHETDTQAIRPAGR